MLDRNFARVWLLAVPLLGCRPGGDEVGTDDVGESGSSGTADGDSSGSESGSGSESSSEATTATTETTAETTAGSETTADTTSETTADTTSETTGGGDNACVADSDCVLVNDCCNCAAAPIGQQLPCDLPECFALTCDAEFGGLEPGVQCSVGTCQLASLSCDLNQVQCDILEPPPCEGGLVRSVNNACYGPCVQPSLCETLPFECDADTCGDGFACMTSQSGAPSKCVPLPEACGGVASCECVAPWFDEICVASCGESGGTLICEDGG